MRSYSDYTSISAPGTQTLTTLTLISDTTVMPFGAKLALQLLIVPTTQRETPCRERHPPSRLYFRPLEPGIESLRDFHRANAIRREFFDGKIDGNQLALLSSTYQNRHPLQADFLHVNNLVDRASKIPSRQGSIGPNAGDMAAALIDKGLARLKQPLQERPKRNAGFQPSRGRNQIIRVLDGEQPSECVFRDLGIVRLALQSDKLSLNPAGAVPSCRCRKTDPKSRHDPGGR